MPDKAPQSSDAPSLEGTLVAGKYRVLRLVGSGGMGTVWEGVHEGLGTRVAVKFIKPQHAFVVDARKRFEIEPQAYDATQHLYNCKGRLRADPIATIRRFADLLEVDSERIRLWMFARLAVDLRATSDADAIALVKALVS